MIYKAHLESILAGLNEDLKREYAAAIQYLQHAAMLSGSVYQGVIDALISHAREEFEHAHVVSKLIVFLGGIPTGQIAQRLVSPDSDEMLTQDLQSEYSAIRRYRERIRQLEADGLCGSAQRIRRIVAEEQKHAECLETALGIIDETLQQDCM